MTDWSIQRGNIFYDWFEGSVSCLGDSGVMENVETFMSMNGLRSSCLARGTRVLEVRKCIFMSGTYGCILLLFNTLFFSL